MDPIERLISIFERFPGIGPRQAQRFVQYLLRSSPALRRELADGISGLTRVHQCAQCMRYFADTSQTCGICSNDARDAGALLITASDADLSAIERSGMYRGYYFVLGGTISLASEKMSGLRLPQLRERVDKRTDSGLREIILAFPANPEGDATAERVRHELSNTGLSITSLGRGLSTGSELEYADPETLKSAIENRK